MTLYCDKTGRHWPAASYEIALCLARHKGLADWTYCTPSAPAPATLRETTDAMRRRGILRREEREARHG